MAYRLKEQRITPNGLNLLAPGDQVEEGACLDLAEWWPGAAGKLEQAPDLQTANSPSITGTQHSLCSASGRLYYGGIDGHLRRIVSGTDSDIDSGYDTTPLGMISYQGYCWIMNRDRQRKDDGTTTSNWTPAVPGAPSLYDLGVGGAGAAAATPSTAVNNPPEVGGLPNSALYYYTTWQYGTLGESNPSPVATITPAANGSIVRISLTLTIPATATGWNIYRKVSSTPYRLNETVISTSRIYVDDYGDEVHTHSDTQLLQLGLIMESDHDAAPAARVMADQVYNGRIVVASSLAHPNRIWFTPALQPAFFRGSANENDGDWADCGTDSGDAILAITCKPGMAIIWRQRSIWRNVGDFGADNGGRLEVVVPDIGITGVRAVVATSLGDYFISQDGVYRFNNDWAQKLSQKVEPVFRGLATENLPTLGTAQRAKMAIGYKSGRIWVSYPNSSGTMIHSLIYHVESQRWFNNSVGYGVFLDTGDAFYSAGSGVFALESSYSAASTLLAFQSEYQDCGLPDHQKTFADLVINHNTQGQTLTVTIRKDRNQFPSTDEFTIGTIASTVLTRSVLPLVLPGTYPAGSPELGTPIKCFNVSVRITGTSALNAPVVIETPMLLHYYVEARKGKTFDSDETDHGMAQVKAVDQIEFDIDVPGSTALFQVYSDAPGGAVIAREGVGQSIPATSGRQAQRIILTETAYGRLLRYTVADAATHQIYGVRVRVLPIGEYLDGTVGEFWQPQPISVGV